MVSFFGFGSPSESSSSALSSRSSSPDLVNSSSVHATAKEVIPLNPQGLKPCCACPETKSRRDDCFLRNTPEEAGESCRELVEAHKACMRGYGFKV